MLRHPKIRTALLKTWTVVLIAAILVVGGLFLKMYVVQWEHLGSHKKKTSVVDNRLEIQLLEELVRKEPNNYRAWRELGKSYRNSFGFEKAREAWDKSLEIAPTGENVDKIKKMIGRMENGHASTSHSRHKKGI